MLADVRTALAVIAIGEAKTQALSVLPAVPSPPREKTIELSDADFILSVAQKTSDAPSFSSALPRRRRQSLIPLAALILYTGLFAAEILRFRGTPSEVANATA